MKSKIILIFLTAVTLCCCQNNTEKILTASNSDNSADNISIITQYEDTSAFCTNLLKEIKKFISLNGDPVISVQIEEKGSERYVTLLTNLYYDSRFLCGYEIIDGRMIAYYYSYADETIDYSDFLRMLETKDKSEMLKESDCAKFLIDNSKLEKGFPISFFDDPHKGYADEKSSFANCCYENCIWKFLIHNTDSLELVYKAKY